MSRTSIGFTGTRHKVNIPQFLGLREVLETISNRWGFYSSPIVFHHGDCVGADAIAAKEAHFQGFIIWAHPCNIEKMRANSPYNQAYEDSKDPIDRNHDIVDASSVLVALPGTRHEVLRSGTWATIRYARQLKRPICLVYPDGSIEWENGADFNKRGTALGG